jgi:thiamine kinase
VTKPHSTIIEELTRSGTLDEGAVVGLVPLAGGYWNEVVRVDLADGRRWVAKRFPETGDNPYFPLDPDSEAMAARVLADSGIAAELVAYLPERRILVTEFLDGDQWDGSVTDVAHLLHRVHTFGSDSRFRRLPVGTAEVIGHGRRILEWGDAQLDHPTLQHDEPGVGGSLVHTDCGPGNMISTPEGLRLIDWQCPGYGDAVEDLVCFVSPAMHILYQQTPLTSARVQRFLAAYPDRPTVDRFHRLRHAYHWRIAAYCAARATRLAETDPEVAQRYRAALQAESELMGDLA